MPPPRTPPRTAREPEPRRAAKPPPQRGLPALRVRHYARMKKQRVYNVVVSWDNEFEYRGPEQDVTVRLQAGGAQVVPAELTLDPKNPKDQALFHVTPLAKGWLRGQKLEIVVNGKKVQEIQLLSRIVSHRWTWLFFFLMFLGPLFVLNFIKGALPSDTAGQEFAALIEGNVPDTPGFIKESLPDVQTALLDLRLALGEGFQTLHEAAWLYGLAFWVGVGFFVLMLLSLWRHSDKRKTRVGKPLFLPRAPTEDEDE